MEITGRQFIDCVELTSYNDEEHVVSVGVVQLGGQLYFADGYGYREMGDEWDGLTDEGLVPFSDVFQLSDLIHRVMRQVEEEYGYTPEQREEIDREVISLLRKAHCL